MEGKSAPPAMSPKPGSVPLPLVSPVPAGLSVPDSVPAPLPALLSPPAPEAPPLGMPLPGLPDDDGLDPLLPLLPEARGAFTQNRSATHWLYAHELSATSSHGDQPHTPVASPSVLTLNASAPAATSANAPSASSDAPAMGSGEKKGKEEKVKLTQLFKHDRILQTVMKFCPYAWLKLKATNRLFIWRLDDQKF